MHCTVSPIFRYGQENEEINAAMKKNTTDLNKFLRNKNLPEFNKLVSVCPPMQRPCGDNKTNNGDNENELDSDDDDDVSEEFKDDSYGYSIFPCGDSDYDDDDDGLCFDGDLSTINEFDDKFEELD